MLTCMSRTFVEKLLSVLEARGISRAEWGRATGVAQNRINKWQEGSNGGIPDTDVLRRTARFLDIPMEWFLDGSDEPPPEPPRPPSAEEREIRDLVGLLGRDEAREILLAEIRRRLDRARAATEPPAPKAEGGYGPGLGGHVNPGPDPPGPAPARARSARRREQDPGGPD